MGSSLFTIRHPIPPVPSGIIVAAVLQPVASRATPPVPRSRGFRRIGQRFEEAIEPRSHGIPQVGRKPEAALMNHGPFRAALRATADLGTAGRIEKVPGHRIGKARTRRGRRGGFGKGHRNSGAGQGPGEGLVDPPVAVHRRGEDRGTPRGSARRKVRSSPCSTRRAPGVASDGRCGAWPGDRTEVTDRHGGVIPVVETRDGLPATARPEEESLVEGHVLRRRTEFGVAPAMEGGEFHGQGFRRTMGNPAAKLGAGK